MPGNLERGAGDLPSTASKVVANGDGLAALAEEIAGAEERSDTVVALVDPPWTRKADWIEVPDALAAAPLWQCRCRRER